MAFPVLDEDTGQLMEYRQLRKNPKYATTWNTSYSNEMDHLCHGIGKNTEGTGKRVEGADTFFVIHYHDIPADRRKEITYTSVVCEVCPQTEYPNRTQITIGGNRICYPGNVGTPTPVPRLASAVTLARGPRPWHGFTHGPFNNTAT